MPRAETRDSTSPPAPTRSRAPGLPCSPRSFNRSTASGPRSRASSRSPHGPSARLRRSSSGGGGTRASGTRANGPHGPGIRSRWSLPRPKGGRTPPGRASGRLRGSRPGARSPRSWPQRCSRRGPPCRYGNRPPRGRRPPPRVGPPAPPRPGVPRLWTPGGGLSPGQPPFADPLGGSAVAPPGERPTVANQFRHTRASLVPIVDLARAGWRISLVHGNGPQVGDELARNEIAADQVEPLPLGVLVAATAGWMGYMIQQSLQNALARAGVTRQVVTVISQTLCGANDPNLRSPTKPIGHALDPVRVARLQARGVPVKEEQRGSWRRLAPSPRPSAVVEREMIHHLVAAGHIVVACGGGRPPGDDDPALRPQGLGALADKDRVAAILGREIAADVLLILTNVDAVYHAYGTPQQKAIRRLNLAQADHLLAGKELGTGSMRPKVEAAADFVRAGGQRAIIAELARGLDALRGEAGTTITQELP